MEIKYPEGATPLDLKSSLELIPRLTNQAELNEFEQINIRLAMDWAKKSRILKKDLISVNGIKLLHKKMFNQTWKWGGVFRQYETNIGVVWSQIPEQLKTLCDDIEYWDSNKIFGLIELAVLLHHRLVSIHPFPNGNGRLSRLVADLFLEYRKHPSLTWGKSSELAINSETRKEYLAALKEADLGKIERLLAFAVGK